MNRADGTSGRLGTLLAVCLAATFSGGAALSYEVLWSRALVVPLGNSSDSAAVVLAGFMLGMAAGAWVGGTLADRVTAPLRWYVAVELLLGAYALVAPGVLFASTGVAVVWLRYGAAFALVAGPGVIMGTTLPLLVQALAASGQPLRFGVGLAYGSNTAGAAVGACVTGFWGIASLGVWRCSALAAVASTLAALLALSASARCRSRSPEPAGIVARRPTRAELAAIVAAAVAGFVVLGAEVLWARVLTFVFGHDSYAFASLLVVVLFGLALGGGVHRALARRSHAVLVPVLLAGLGVALLLSFWGAAALVVAWGRDPFGLQSGSLLARSVWLELWRELAYTPVLILLPSVLSGALFPAACTLFAGSDGRVGSAVGWVGLSNGIAATVGALAAAAVLVPAAGLEGAFVALALVAGIGAAASVTLLVVRLDRRSTLGAVGAFAAVAAAALVLPERLPRAMLLRVVGPRHQQLLHYEEARTGTVSVVRNRINGEKQLLLNAVNEVTTRLVHDQSFKVLGHLAPLLHPKPQRALMVCLGAGLSAGAALTHPLQRLEVVDLSSAIPRAARHWADENLHVLDHPAFRLRVDDGRQFLLNSPGGYDVVIVDSTHPKAVDSWILYTREFYELVRQRLASGGVLVQWLPLHGLSEQEFKIIVRTFQAAFPEMTLWANAGYETYGQVAYAKLVATRDGPVRVDYPRLLARLAEPAVRQDLEPWGLSRPAEFLDAFLAGPQAVARWTGDLPVQTDDHPLVPYTTRFSEGRSMTPELLLGVREPFGDVLVGASAAARDAIEASRDAQGLVLGGLLARAGELHPDSRKVRLFASQAASTRPYYLAYAGLYSDDADRLFEAGTQLGAHGHSQEARRLFEEALALRPEDFRLRTNLAVLLGDLGAPQASAAALAAIWQDHPREPFILYNLGAHALRAGESGVAVGHLRQALAWAPGELQPRLLLGEALLGLGEVAEAQAELERVLASNPWVAEAHDLLGLLEVRRGAAAAAAKHHARAVELHRYRARFHFNLGVAEQASGQFARARAAYEEALRLDPDRAAAANNLGLLAAAVADHVRAAELYVRALEIDPNYAAAAHNLGLALLEQDRGGEARSAFCLALRIDPTLTRSGTELGRLPGGERACP